MDQPYFGIRFFACIKVYIISVVGVWWLTKDLRRSNSINLQNALTNSCNKFERFSWKNSSSEPFENHLETDQTNGAPTTVLRRFCWKICKSPKLMFRVPVYSKRANDSKFPQTKVVNEKRLENILQIHWIQFRRNSESEKGTTAWCLPQHLERIPK